MTTTITVNGERHETAADPDTPLLYVLRNDLGLLGARFGCGLGLCGACMVHVDGVAVPSCDTPLWSLEGKSVVTVEGISPHPVQAAFLDGQAAQCGYCVTGIVMSAAALLDNDADPSRATVMSALDRHLCRCGVQQRMVDAVLRAKEHGRETGGRPDAGTVA